MILFFFLFFFFFLHNRIAFGKAFSKKVQHLHKHDTRRFYTLVFFATSFVAWQFLHEDPQNMAFHPLFL
jgi:hypothetical protein